MRATAGEVISARDEANQDGTLRPASRGDETGIVTRSGRLRPLLPRHPTAIVRHDGATSAAPRRGAHRRRRAFPGRTRLLVAAVGAAIAAYSATTVGAKRNPLLAASSIIQQSGTNERPSSG